MALCPDRFVLATLHRDYTVDTPTSLRAMLEGLVSIQEQHGLTVVLPLHPHTRKWTQHFGLTNILSRLLTCDPIGYMELMSLTCVARFMITDSGGLQKEAYYAGKRCAVMMPDTGWRGLTDCGWNITLYARSRKHSAGSLPHHIPLHIRAKSMAPE
ncbi:UDP-N-acetylglucosamine 2-epimerase [uncultured Desulfovibrio sp.]|uniref:UDP-N-acetylglucosamine 2-epimerase n=1 Tax=uncultured Desulfovibrio sp. TaxID=167968 RepID=UPI0034C5CE12